MPDDRAKHIIEMRNSERAAQQGLWNTLWQDAADYCYQTEDQIIRRDSPGTDSSASRYDDTAEFDSAEMASGLLAMIVPTGQKFFDFSMKNGALMEMDHIRRWLLYASEVLHNELFESNFMLQLNETLRSLVVFGTGCLYSEFDRKSRRLNFKDHPISYYQIRENSAGIVDTVILSYTYTAKQAIDQFGEDAVCKDILDAARTLDKETETFDFIHVVRPRTKLNPLLKDSRNMPWESVHVDVKDQSIVRESGYSLMPFHVARWAKRSSEKYGRGQATQAISTIRMLQRMSYNYIDLCNRYARPPMEVMDEFEGDVDIRPGAINRVTQLNSIKGIGQDILGNPPVTEQMLEQQRQLVHKAFYRDVLVPITDLKGDRRTVAEITARQQEGLRRLASPGYRVNSELMTPAITRSLMLLIDNMRVPPPPPELAGEEFAIEYQGQLALALRDQQARGFMQFAQYATQMATVDPTALDGVNLVRGSRDVAIAMGVRAGVLATQEEMQAKADARAKQQQLMMEMEMAKTMGKTYKDASGAPEEGSPAGQLMEQG